MNIKISDFLFLFSISGLIILADQLTKLFIRANLAPTEIYHPEWWITQYVRLLHWHNTGAAFGIFQNLGGVFTVLSFVVSLAIIYYFPQIPAQDRFVRLALAMLLGGAVGNLIDRLHQGYVTDFISVGDFPVFNIADASISIGVAILFLGMWMQERQKARENTLADRPETLVSSEEQPGE